MFVVFSSSVKRTQVIDDEADYFATDTQWLSKSEKQALRKREEELRNIRHASRKDRKITLDFAGRRVVEDEQSVDVYDMNDEVVQVVHYGKTSQPNSGPTFTADDFTALTNPSINIDAPKVGYCPMCSFTLWNTLDMLCHLTLIPFWKEMFTIAFGDLKIELSLVALQCLNNELLYC